MSAITLNKERIGNITSSKACKLFASKSTYANYIESKQRELRLCRAIEVDSYSQAISWGELMEKRVNDLLGIAYAPTGQVSLHHPNKELRWAGSPDITNERERIVCEVKGYYPDNFSYFTDRILQAKRDGKPDILRKECPDEYWQAVSNACLLGYNTIELICYMPKEDELEAISEIANNWDDPISQWRYKWIFDAFTNGQVEKLPYLPKDSQYESLNTYRFEMPKEDSEALKNAVIKATAEINRALISVAA